MESFRRSLELKVSYQFLINYQNQPFGFIQYYWASKVGDGWWLEYGEDVIGIDLYIANINLLSKGHGSCLLEYFVDTVIKPLDAKLLICDPNPKNYRAINCFKKVGFRASGEVATPDGVALLMKKSL